MKKLLMVTLASLALASVTYASPPEVFKEPTDYGVVDKIDYAIVSTPFVNDVMVVTINVFSNDIAFLIEPVLPVVSNFIAPVQVKQSVYFTFSDFWHKPPILLQTGKPLEGYIRRHKLPPSGNNRRLHGLHEPPLIC